MTDQLTTEVTEWQKKQDAATAGPWFVHRFGPEVSGGNMHYEVSCSTPDHIGVLLLLKGLTGTEKESAENAAFITHARNSDLPERLEADRQRLIREKAPLYTDRIKDLEREIERLKTERDNLVMLVNRLVYQVRQTATDQTVSNQALDYLARIGAMPTPEKGGEDG